VSLGRRAAEARLRGTQAQRERLNDWGRGRYNGPARDDGRCLSEYEGPMRAPSRCEDLPLPEGFDPDGAVAFVVGEKPE
jgi:hypothetical protein